MTATNGHLRVKVPKTAGYQPGQQWNAAYANVLTTGQIPFNLRYVEEMRRDPQVQFVEWVWRSPVHTAKWKVVAEYPEVQKYVDAQLKRLWQQDLVHALDMLAYTAAGGEVVDREEDGLLQVDYLKHIQFWHARPVALNGQLVGLNVYNVADHQGPVTLGRGREGRLIPGEWWWCINEDQHGSFQGRSRFAGMFHPWLEKVGTNGALAARRLWYIKNATDGGTMRHPMSKIATDDGKEMEAQDYARQVLEQRQSGNPLILPNDRDDKGNFLWDYEKPSVAGDLSDVREYVKDLEVEEVKGGRIPPEVIEAAATGSGWSGRSVPWVVFLTGEDQIVDAVVRTWDRQIIQPRVKENFDPKKRKYRIEPVSLIPPPDEQGKPQTGTGGGPEQPQPGLPGQAGQPYQPPDQPAQPKPPVQMSTDAAGHEHRGPGEGGGQFTGAGDSGGGVKEPEKAKATANVLALKDPYKEEDSGLARKENKAKLVDHLTSLRKPGWGAPDPNKSDSYAGPKMWIEGVPGFGISPSLHAPFVVYATAERKNAGKFKTVEKAMAATERMYAQYVAAYPEKRTPPEDSPAAEVLARTGKPTEDQKKEAAKTDQEVLPTGTLTPKGHGICPKCNGFGQLGEYGHVAQGVCFKCNGKGYVPKSRLSLWPRPDPVTGEVVALSTDAGYLVDEDTGECFTEADVIRLGWTHDPTAPRSKIRYRNDQTGKVAYFRNVPGERRKAAPKPAPVPRAKGAHPRLDALEAKIGPHAQAGPLPREHVASANRAYGQLRRAHGGNLVERLHELADADVAALEKAQGELEHVKEGSNPLRNRLEGEAARLKARLAAYGHMVERAAGEGLGKEEPKAKEKKAEKPKAEPVKAAERKTKEESKPKAETERRQKENLKKGPEIPVVEKVPRRETGRSAEKPAPPLESRLAALHKADPTFADTVINQYLTYTNKAGATKAQRHQALEQLLDPPDDATDMWLADALRDLPERHAATHGGKGRLTPDEFRALARKHFKLSFGWGDGATGEVYRLTADAAGHAHKGRGQGGGQFAPKGGGGQGPLAPQQPRPQTPAPAPRPQPQAAQPPPAAGPPDTSKGSVVHLRSLIGGQGDDADKAFGMVYAAVHRHQAQGGQLAIHTNGKRIPVRAEGSKLVDAKGQPWGMLALAMDSPDQPGLIEFVPKGQAQLHPDVFARLKKQAVGVQKPPRLSFGVGDPATGEVFALAFDESKVNRSHGQFAPKHTDSEAVPHLTEHVKRIAAAHYGQAHLGDVREAVPHWQPHEFEHVLHNARRQRLVTLSAAEGRHGLEPRDKASAVYEADPVTGERSMLLYASPREEARLAFDEARHPRGHEGNAGQFKKVAELEAKHKEAMGRITGGGLKGDELAKAHAEARGVHKELMAARAGDRQAAGFDRAAVEKELGQLNQPDRRTGMTPLIPDLYDRLKETHPGLTEPAFHALLHDMQQQDKLTLQVWGGSGAENLPKQTGHAVERFPDHPRHGKAAWVRLRDESARLSWESYQGARGGTGWKHTGTGEVRYQEARPGEEESGGGTSPYLIKRLKKSAPEKQPAPESSTRHPGPPDHATALKDLIAAKAKGEDEGGQDPRGDLAHLPTGDRLTAARQAIAGTVSEAAKRTSVGVSVHDLYATVGPQLNLSPPEFRAVLLDMHHGGANRLGGWARMLDDLPRPDLAPVVSGKVMGYVHPKEGTQLSSDATGHEHKGKGEGGGQFTGTGAAAQGQSADAGGQSADLPAPVRSKLAALLAHAAAMPAAVKAKAVAFVAKRYAAMSERYGPTGAKLVLGGALLLLPVPVPGTSWAAVGLAEGIRALAHLWKRVRMGMEDAAGDLVPAVAELVQGLCAELGEQVPVSLNPAKVVEALKAATEGETRLAFNPDEKRDESGKWTAGDVSTSVDKADKGGDNTSGGGTKPEPEKKPMTQPYRTPEQARKSLSRRADDIADVARVEPLPAGGLEGETYPAGEGVSLVITADAVWRVVGQRGWRVPLNPKMVEAIRQDAAAVAAPPPPPPPAKKPLTPEEAQAEANRRANLDAQDRMGRHD